MASGEIITNPTASNLGNGAYEDLASYSLASIIEQGGIVIGDKRFDSFTAVTSKTSYAVAPDADEIMITAVLVDGDRDLPRRRSRLRRLHGPDEDLPGVERKGLALPLPRLEPRQVEDPRRRGNHLLLRRLLLRDHVVQVVRELFS